MVNMYVYDNKSKLMHWSFFLCIVMLAIFMKPIYLQIMFVVIAIMLLKDNVKMIRTQINILPDMIQYLVGGQVEKEVSFRDIEMITYTKNSKKILIVVTFDGTIYKLPKQLNDFDKLMKEIIEFTKKNKKLVIHENLLVEYK